MKQKAEGKRQKAKGKKAKGRRQRPEGRTMLLRTPRPGAARWKPWRKRQRITRFARLEGTLAVKDGDRVAPHVS